MKSVYRLGLLVVAMVTLAFGCEKNTATIDAVKNIPYYALRGHCAHPHCANERAAGYLSIRLLIHYGKLFDAYGVAQANKGF